MPPTKIKYRAVHEITPWRKARHKTLKSALLGEQDGAPGLFAHRARINYDLHGEPLFVAVWEEGGRTGYLVKRDSSSSDGTMRVSVDFRLLEGFEADGGATIAELEALFSSAMIDQTSPRVIVEEHPTIDEADEGALLLNEHLLRERNFALVKSKKASVLASTGCLACEVCNFDFTLMYGEIGAGYC